jgi:SpoVK/Ycf46/Vps4 family AAA+-type ATPase
LPAWAAELKQRYLRGEAALFILHGNVHDVVHHDGQLLAIADFLAQVLLPPSKDIILHYNLSTGVRFARKKKDLANLDDLLLHRSADKILPAIERVLMTSDKVAAIIDFAEMLAPAGDANFFSETDRQSVIAMQRWSMSPTLDRADNVVLLITENLSELHPKLVANPRTATLQIPVPDEATRRTLIQHVAPRFDATWADRLVDVTAGLKGVQLRGLLEPTTSAANDEAERERFIRTLLAGSPAADERARKLAALTVGLGHDEIRKLVAPIHATAGDAAATPSASVEQDEQAQLLRLIFRRKRELIERECAGLIEFVEPDHDLSVVGGIEAVKADLLAVARNLREGRRKRCPMGILFTGPMGTGKTFVAEAFVRETGLTAIKLKSFRSKWVGATEGNLERILSVIQAIGQVIVIIDEGDRAFGSGEGDNDGGTSSRVIARIKEFMSDTNNRGRVLFIVMTNRPDKLDVDLKRAGRLDRKIPFLYPQTPEEVEGVLTALFRKNAIRHAVELPRDRVTVSARLVGYSNAELEAVTLLAQDYAQDEAVTPQHLADAIRDYLASRDSEMLEYMELLAVFEASNRKMLPPKYADLTVDELQRRLASLRAKVGLRR